MTHHYAPINLLSAFNVLGNIDGDAPHPRIDILLELAGS